MNWVILSIAGLLEVVWAIGLKHSAGFTKPVPSLITIVAMISSIYLLGIALRSLPLGTAYAIWVGIGAVGTVAVSALLFEEAMSPLKLLSIALVVAGILGLKVASTA